MENKSHVPNHQPDITWGSIYNPIPLILNTPIAWHYIITNKNMFQTTNQLHCAEMDQETGIFFGCSWDTIGY
jgi:hypothetical protein